MMKAIEIQAGALADIRALACPSTRQSAIISEIARTLSKRGWKIKFRPTVIAKWYVSEIDLAAERWGKLSAFRILTSRGAAYSDLLVLAAVNSAKKFMVAESWKSRTVEDRAQALGILLVGLDTLPATMAAMSMEKTGLLARLLGMLIFRLMASGTL